MRTVKPWSRVVVASSLIVLAVATWVFLGRLRPRAEWVQVRGPRYVLVARPLELQLTLSGLERPAWLTVDLHRVEAPDGPGRFLMTVGSMRVGPGSGRAGRSAGTSAFAFQVPPLDDLRWVFAVVYVSQTGSWGDRFLAAGTERIPVRLSGDPPRGSVNWMTYRSEVGRVSSSAARGDRQASAKPADTATRLSLALAALAGAALCTGCALRRRRVRSPRGTGKVVAVRWALLAAFLAFAAAWQYASLGELAAGTLRRYAEQRGIYHLREVAQRAVIAGALTAVAALGLSLLTGRRRLSPITIAALGAAVVGAVLVVHVVSFHYADALEGASILGLGLADLFKGAGLLAVLGGAAAGLVRSGRTRR